MKTACASILLLASMAMAKDHVVLVASSGLTFSPDQINATVGDTVSFQFVKGVWMKIEKMLTEAESLGRTIHLRPALHT
jgi:plastocyanin